MTQLQAAAKALRGANDRSLTNVLILSGDAGIGKTRLAQVERCWWLPGALISVWQELIKLVGHTPVIAGEASEMDRSTSFHAWKVSNRK